jgi:hypothetical protein
MAGLGCGLPVTLKRTDAAEDAQPCAARPSRRAGREGAITNLSPRGEERAIANRASCCRKRRPCIPSPPRRPAHTKNGDQGTTLIAVLVLRKRGPYQSAFRRAIGARCRHSRPLQAFAPVAGRNYGRSCTGSGNCLCSYNQCGKDVIGVKCTATPG